MLFTEITSLLKYPAKKRNCSKLKQEHLKIVDYAINNFSNTQMFRRDIINAMNYISTQFLSGDTIDTLDFTSENPFAHIKKVNGDTYKPILGDLYIDYRSIEWNITPAEKPAVSNNKPKLIKQKQGVVVDTPKEDLYLRAPQYPRFDTSNYWLSDTIGSEHFYIHPSLPIVPEKQGDVSCTTDVNKMTEKELLKLYPNHLIHTRDPIMYEPIDGVTMDKDLGLLIPIAGYTLEQLRDNIIRYPHFFQLTRMLNDKEISFYKHIEIDGQLYDTLEVWDSLPISKKLPKTSEFIKEYIVRKYLLDRDAGMEHKYPLHGTLDPFLTIFAPMEFYSAYGNPAELMRKCVLSRVSFFQSRNPYIANYLQVKQGERLPYGTIHCPFKPYCRKSTCDAACPDLLEIQYLLERNNLNNNNSIYTLPVKDIQKASEWLTAASNPLRVVISDNTLDTASCLTYAAICKHWKGNTLHCSVYRLDFADYIDREKSSYSTYTPDDMFEYIKIFIQKAKVLIISNIDFMQFNDFNAKTLIAILSRRMFNQQTTIVISPKLNKLMGSGQVYQALIDLLRKGVVD